MRGRAVRTAIWWLLLYQLGTEGAYVGYAIPLPNEPACHAVTDSLRRSIDPLPVVAYVCRDDTLQQQVAEVSRPNPAAI